ncbi:MAG: hypothetical protein GDA43_21560 [Hormoscilla sp. SP5CHS1]|nr:hypothetical protein [Hormoscilla sp. SP12CHS1]MBC6455457.1 hypothetical protein [Hormoscilla sp. SP5CHS1]MBC6473847.1 hypothetical protein [Hormoscilla sp. GM102CHS1]
MLAYKSTTLLCLSGSATTMSPLVPRLRRGNVRLALPGNIERPGDAAPGDAAPGDTATGKQTTADILRRVRNCADRAAWRQPCECSQYVQRIPELRRQEKRRGEQRGGS